MAPTAGYSGTPLPKKLGLKDNFLIATQNLPAEVERELQAALAACRIAKKTETGLNFVMIFVKAQADLEREFPRYTKRLAPAGMLWVSWPKKTSGVPTDLTGNEVRNIGLACGLVDIKVCAVSEVWSGLKFVIPVKNRKSSI